jgi:hypothetical protein
MCKCSKKQFDTPRAAMIALARAAMARELGDRRGEVRFYACPSAGTGSALFHLTSVPATIGDRSSYALLSSRILSSPSSILSRA